MGWPARRTRPAGPGAIGRCLALAACSLAVPGIRADPEAAAHRAATRARSLVESGRAAEAVPIYLELLEAAPGDSRIRRNLAVARFKAAQYRETISLCRQTLQLNPRSVAARLFLGASHFQLREYGAAIGPLTRVLSDRPDEPNARLMLAESLLLLERHGEALHHFRAVATQLETNPRVWYGLNRVHRKLQAADSRSLERSFAGDAFAQASAGLEARDRGGYGLASSHLREALARRDALGQAATRIVVRALAAIYRETGHSDRAAGLERANPEPGVTNCTGPDAGCIYERGEYADLVDSTADASSPASLFWRSRAHAALASQAIRRLAAMPESAQLHELRARRLDLGGSHRQAARSWRRALDLDPSNPVLATGLASASYEAQDYAGVLGVLERFLPDRATPEMHFLHGSASLSLHGLAKAIASLSRAVRIRPDSERARAELSRAYLLDGQPQRAIEQLERILDADPDGSYHYRLGQAYGQLGDSASATMALETYRKLRARASGADAQRIERLSVRPQ